MENQSQNVQKPRSLKSRMLFHYALLGNTAAGIICIYGFSYRNEILEKSEMMLNLGIENVTSTISQRIDEAITASKTIL